MFGARFVCLTAPMSFILVGLGFLFSLNCIDCLSCYKCQDVSRVEDCTTIVACKYGEICYQDKVNGSDGVTRNLGCRHVRKCASNSQSFKLENTNGDNCTACCNTGTCNRGLCWSEDGGFSEWSIWSACDVTCGNGTRTRTRECYNSIPKRCTGEVTQHQECTQTKCQEARHWSDWSSWGSCSVTCGTGLQRRERTCLNPKPALGGEWCQGDAGDYRICTLLTCTDVQSSFSVSNPKSRINRYLTFSRVLLNPSGDFNESTGLFTCRIPGVYVFSFTLVKRRQRGVNEVGCALFKNDDYVIEGHVNPTVDNTDKESAYAGNSAVIQLDRGDNVGLNYCTNPSTTMESWTSFSGFLLYHQF